uniref:Uncharacterized protein n=1 Tax=Ditylenchus dipsaci TaxID=166011 RepID=A0A915E8X4_9BILA
MCAMFARIPPIDQFYLFYFSSCGHLFCSTVQRSKPSSLLEVNRNLRPEVQMYFRSARDLSVQYMQNLKSVMEFQGHHRHRLQHVSERTSKAVKFAGAAKAQIEENGGEGKKMSAERTQMIRELEKQAERSRIMEKMLVFRLAFHQPAILRIAKRIQKFAAFGLIVCVGQFCTLDKTSSGRDLFLSPNDCERNIKQGVFSGSSIASSASSGNSSQLSRSLTAAAASITRFYLQVDLVRRFFSTSFDGKFKVPKLVPLNFQGPSLMVLVLHRMLSMSLPMNLMEM